MSQLINTALNDFKLIFREPSLRVFLAMPLLIILLITVFLPSLLEKYEVLQEYVPYILMAAVYQTATMLGFIYCMVLIDEKDNEVNKVYGVLPISKTKLIVYRIIFPWLFASIITYVVLSIQPFYIFPTTYNVSLSLLTGLMGPVFALLITNLSSNKMQGMTYYKGINGLLNLPLLAFFIPEVYTKYFAMIPSHWVFQEINNLVTGHQLYLNLIIGYVVCFALLGWLVLQFSRKHFV